MERKKEEDRGGGLEFTTWRGGENVKCKRVTREGARILEEMEKIFRGW